MDRSIVLTNSSSRSKHRQEVRFPRRGPLSSEAVDTLEAACQLYEALDTPVSLSCYLMMKSQLLVKGPELRQLVEKSVDPSNYLDATSVAEKFARDRLATCLMSKYRGNVGIDTRQKALERWREAEQMNLATNARFRTYASELGGFHDPSWFQGLDEILYLARRNVARCLGLFHWRHAFDKMAFGPGATQETSGSVSLFKKFSAPAVASPSCVTIASHVVGFTPHWMEALTGVIPSGPCCYLGIVAKDDASVAFVPKSAKTDRAIGIEHGLNIYIQKGIGAVIRRRLRDVGIDLDDQSTNQDLAQRAYRDSLATIDLSMASDTVATGFVRFMLPDDWFSALNSVRSHVSRFGEEEIPNQKFSSMGNGFTFELESLLFWALSCACRQLYGSDDDPIGVYGDDLVVPNYWSSQLTDTLSFCGFKVNEEKSFSSGPFYESCGKDFFLGLDVRPFFFKEGLKEPGDYYWFYNQVLDFGYRRNLRGWGGRFGRVLGCIFRSIRPVYRFRVPRGWGSDTGFYSSRPEDAPPFFTRNGWCIYRFKYWGNRAATVQTDCAGGLAAKLSQLVDSGPRFVLNEVRPGSGNSFPVRARKAARRTAVGYTHSWS